MTKKVVIVLTMKPTEGGKFQYCLSMLDALNLFDQEKFALEAIYADNKWESYIPEWFIKSKVKHDNKFQYLLKKILHKLPLGVRFYQKISKYVSNFHGKLSAAYPDVVLYPGNESFVYENRFAGVIPIFDLMHRYENYPELHENGIFNWREKHYGRVCKYARGILVDSNVGLQHVKDCYDVDEKKIHVLEYIAPSYVRANITDDVLEEFDLPDSFIFYPAQLWQHKNHVRLIKAIGILKEKYDLRINLVLVGADKNSNEEIINTIQNNDLQTQIFFLKYVSNEVLVALYKRASALIMPSLLGPTNIPQLEAFALGCPVLTSNIYGVPEQVGDAAILFNPKSEEDIADKIRCIISDDLFREKLISNGLLRDKYHNIQRFKIRIEEVISKLA
jgi:glycosyltransferase involved in cell wall biosynthesis